MTSLLRSAAQKVVPLRWRTVLYRWRRDARPGRFLFVVPALLHLLSRRLIRRRADRDPAVHRMLVVSAGGIGDLLMATPAIRALADRYPQAEIDLLTLHHYVGEGFRDYPRFHDILYVGLYPAGRPEKRFAAVRSRLHGALTILWYYPRLLWRVAARGYDVGINFSLSAEYDQFGNALLYAAGIPRRLGMHDHAMGFLTFGASIEVKRSHHVDAYLQAVAPLEVSVGSHDYEFPIDDATRQRIRASLADIRASGPLVALHPGGRILINSRRWPARYFAEVGRALVRECGATVVLLGDDTERQLCEGIALEIGEQALSMAGRLSLAETAALLGECQLCITNDTATLHLAEAVRAPRVISIFGPTAHEILAPRSDRHHVLFSRLLCAPCLGGAITKDSPRCWRLIKEECLWGIEPERVIGPAREALAAWAAGVNGTR